MDSSTAIQPNPTPPEPPPAPVPRKKPKNIIVLGLEALASLKFTVILFALSMGLVFFGTVAQRDDDVWRVVYTYFRTWDFVLIPGRVLAWPWADVAPGSTFGKIRIPYPGGWTLGGLLFVNLIAAHIVRFRLRWNRAGIIILHFGIVLMMVGEFLTGKFAVENMMTIRKGETVNFVHDNRAPELAVVDVTDPNRTEDDIVAIYLPALKRGKISDPLLPFDLEVLEYQPNSDVVEVQPGDAPAVADRGQAKGLVIKKLTPGNGVDTASKIDMPSALVRVKSKDGKDLGTYILSFWMTRGDAIEVGDKKYEISLRPKRSYRDFNVFLEDAKERKQPGTEIAKDYSSYIVLNDPAYGVIDRPYHIYMNSPMRYRGEAFFQANMATGPRGEMTTGLQVVRNEINLPIIGVLYVWTLPYISCVVVAIGMLIHFGVNLVGFLKIQARTF